MKILLNGQVHTLAQDPTPLLALLASQGWSTEGIAVVLNRQLIRQSEQAQCLVHADDQIEVLTAVVGG